MLLDIQGCGKSLAAKTVAGIFAAPPAPPGFCQPLQQVAWETEKYLRDALHTAGLMAPCVLWLDEIEKGLFTSESDDGTSKRILGTLLTWMAVRRENVFMVATSNDIEALPQELVHKGRQDEIFFVDLLDARVREQIFLIHRTRREQNPADFDLPALMEASTGFSGAEIEQTIVSGLCAALGQACALDDAILLAEIKNTYSLSLTMAENLQWLRQWADSRAVKVD